MSKCSICGMPMPKGEEMFKCHGYSGPCPAPAQPRPDPVDAVASAIWSGMARENYLHRAGLFDDAHADDKEAVRRIANEAIAAAPKLAGGSSE